jgi:hypothetical protein
MLSLAGAVDESNFSFAGVQVVRNTLICSDFHTNELAVVI